MKIDKRLLRQLPGIRSYLIVIVLMGTLLGILVIIQAYALSHIISRVFLSARTLSQVWGLMLIFLGVILVRACIAWSREVAASHIAGRIKTYLRERLLSHLFSLGPTYTRGERSGELVSTIVEGVEALDPYFSQYLPQYFLSVLVPALILITIFTVDVPSGIILLIIAPILPLLMAMVGLMARAETKRHWHTLRLMSAHFLDVLQGLTTLKLFGHSQEEEAQIRQVSEQFRHTTMGTLRIAFFSSFILEEGATISAAIIAVEIGFRLLIGQMPFQPGLFVLLLAPEFFLPLRLLGAKYHAGMTGSAAMQRLVEILETPVPQAGPVPYASAQQPTLQEMPPARIHFDHVDYAYDGQRPALHGVSFHISAGQKVALVGPSGAGKSTLAHLLMRFIVAGSGVVWIDGKDLEEIPAQQWRTQVAWVPQHPYLFHATVAENIRLGCPRATLEEVMEAAQLAHAHAFISGLPQAYDTVIGERGARLSGGEAQRLSLARAFLKNAPLLILDEVTSHLDPDHEAQVLEALARLKQGRTVLIIAHRLSTVYDADQIVLLKEGRVVAMGTHASVLRQSEFYRQLITAYQGREG